VSNLTLLPPQSGIHFCSNAVAQGKHMSHPFRILPRPLVLATAAIALASGFASGPADAAGGAFLAHQALYELSLLKSRGSNSINSARGRILYNFTGSACEGYTSAFRQVS
jgi:hypothetical protein